MGKDLADLQSYQDMIKALTVFSDEIRTNTSILNVAANTCVANMGSDLTSTKYAMQLHEEITKFGSVYPLIDNLIKGLQDEMHGMEEIMSGT